MKNRFIVAALLGLALSISSVHAQDKDMDKQIDTVLGDHTKYVAVIQALQKAVKGKDATTVAGLVSYPVKVTLAGKAKTYKATKDFVAAYDHVMTPEITGVVVNQKYSDLIVNSQGIGFGAGQVWINGICKDTACKNFDVKITMIQSGP